VGHFQGRTLRKNSLELKESSTMYKVGDGVSEKLMKMRIFTVKKYIPS
jgi:hypothetical protein